VRLKEADKARVARLYWRRELPATEIARQFGIRRETVARIAKSQKEMVLATDIAEDLIATPEIMGIDPEKDTRVSPDRNEGDI